MDKIVHFLCFFLSLTASSYGAQPLNALVAQITQPDPSSSLYTITLNQKKKLVIDIESPFSWHHCPKTSPRVSCLTPQCSAAHSYKPPFCHLQIPKTCTTCLTFPSNPTTKTCASSQLTYINISISTTDGNSPLARAHYNKMYMSCAPKPPLTSLPKGASGFASLSKGSLSLVSQFSTSKVTKKLGLCLADQGVAFFGEGPFNLLPGTGTGSPPEGEDVIQSLTWTPLLKNPYDPLGYYIGLKGISIANLEAVKLLKSDGVKLSTITPYTSLRSEIYKAVVNKYGMIMKDIPRVPKVAPFELCFNSTSLSFSKVGVLGPQIDLQLSSGANWTIYGFNSLKIVSTDAACLALVDGGEKAEEAVVIGLFQMLHNFLLFDSVKSRFGFSGLLFFLQTNCNNFNFTTGVAN